jgi:phage tail-like protein
MTEENKQSRYLEYLPAIFHTDPTQDPAQPAKASYLGQFLLPFEEVLTGFEDLLSVIDRYFTPALTPSETGQDFLRWLAGWVAWVLDENLDESKQRRLIGMAVRLYRLRGMVSGLERFLKIYDDRIAPDVREGRWPAGMQIGVASQIGKIAPDDIPLSRIERMARQQPPVRYDYYVVDTLAPASHPDVPEGQPLRLYYRADLVKSVTIGSQAEQNYVTIRLLDGRIRRHQPAMVVRYDGLIHECYSLTIGPESGPETIIYRGDTFLINEVELPYRFTVDIRVPCMDWAFLFSLQIDLEAGEPLEALWREFEFQGITISDAASVTVEAKGRRWWKIDDEARSYIAVRKGSVLDVYTWVGCRGWAEARQLFSVPAIRAIIDEVKPAHTEYYLKLTPVRSEYMLQPMQIGLRSRIDVDVSIG